MLLRSPTPPPLPPHAVPLESMEGEYRPPVPPHRNRQPSPCEMEQMRMSPIPNMNGNLNMNMRPDKRVSGRVGKFSENGRRHHHHHHHHHRNSGSKGTETRFSTYLKEVCIY